MAVSVSGGQARTAQIDASVAPKGPVTPPVTPKGKATRAKLLAAAGTVFGRVGYQGTRIADIVAEAGISHGLFYRHFADKDAILLSVLEQLNEELRRTTGRAVGEDDTLTLARLEQRNIHFFEDYRRNRLLLRVAREAAAQEGDYGFREMWLQMRDRFVERTRRWLVRLQESGAVFPLTDTDMIAEGLCALTEQMAYVQVGLARCDPDDATIERLGKASALIWYRSVTGRAA